MKLYLAIPVTVFFSCFGLSCFAACPSMDFTDDCIVDFADFAEFASQWLDKGSYTLYVNSSGASGVNISSSTGHNGTTNYTQAITVGTSVSLTAPAAVSDTNFTGWTGDVNSSELTISFSMDANTTVTANYSAEVTGMEWVDINEPNFAGEMSKYETTNAQYCQFLNAALASGDINVDGDIVYDTNDTSHSQPYYNLAGTGSTYNGATNGGASRINYTGSSFSVDSNFESHPVTYVSWYGSTAFCNYYEYRLPTEWEWQAAADYNSTYIYGCGTSINHSIANYYNSSHPDGTTVAGAFGTYGYGMCDMAGNVWEWTSSIYSSYRIIRGGCWASGSTECAVSFRSYDSLNNMSCYFGFRVCR